MDHIDPNWRRLADGLAFPEGPAFGQDEAVWAVDLETGALIRRTEESVTRFEVGGSPNGLAFRDGEPWFCDRVQGAIRRLRPDGGTQTVVADAAGTPLDMPNDLAFDRLGNLVFTCPGDSRTKPSGTVWCWRRDGVLTLVADGLFFPNGLAFDPSGEELIVAETYQQRLWRGAWDAQEARWTNFQPWAQTGGPTGPDGMAFDALGHLHVAVFGQGEIAVFAPNGAKVASLAAPGQRPTNVAFDPSGRLGLVVTEVDTGALWSWAQAPAGARLFG